MTTFSMPRPCPNLFPSDARWAFAGIRLASDA